MDKLSDNEIMDQIEMVRNHNNRLWMMMVRLALKAAPEEAKHILKSIKNNDLEISKWMDEF